MTKSLAPKHGLDWRRIRWDDANAPQRNDCSYCGVAIPEEAVPLRVWNERGDGCVFCDSCCSRWFGLETFEDEP